MKNTFIRVISMVLTVALLLCAAVPVLAEEYEDEEYLSDLRIIYAEDYDEAAEILEDSGLEGYRLLNANLNENTGKIGVFLISDAVFLQNIQCAGNGGFILFAPVAKIRRRQSF